MIRSNGNFNGISNRNFAQMLEEINLNLQSFPMTSLSNNNNNSSSNAGNSHSNNNHSSSNNNGQPSGIIGHSSSNAIQASLLHGDSSSSSSQIGGGYQLRYQLPPNNSNNQYESSSNNYARNRENNSQHGQSEQYSQNNNRKKQNSSPKIQDILTCFICLGKLRNAHMCPDCQKMCCEGCIKEWLSNKSQCPHCRSHLRPSKLMKCRFVSEITTALEKIEQIEQKKEKQGICNEHDNPLQYYCQMCKHPVCSDCGMIGSKHKNHKFEKLNAVYDTHVKQVKLELSAVKQKLTELSKQQLEVDIVIDRITQMKEDKSATLRQQMDYVNIKLNDLLKTKLEKLNYQRGPISEEIDLLENMTEEINHHIESLPKPMMINKSNEIIKTLEEINNRRVLKNYISDNDKKLEFSYDIIPPYDSSDFFLENYSVKRRGADVAYSDTLFAHGNEWRLKVYLNGKDKAKDSYLSVFVEMTKGSLKPSNFEYRVEMINQINPDLRVTREFVSPFETGATWGYERFFKLDQLESEGYLLPESDMLILKYYVRSPSYSQFCHSKQNRIEELESKNSLLLEEIKQIKEAQQQAKNSQGDFANIQGSEQIKYEGINESKAENFELETFINDIDNGNISNIRSELENYIKQKNLEEFAKSDIDEDQDNINDHDHDDEEEDDHDDEDDQEEEDVDDEDDVEDEQEEEDEEENEGSLREIYFAESQDHNGNQKVQNSDHQDDEYLYDNEEDIYQYKRSDNTGKDQQKMVKVNQGDDEFENDQNEPMEYDSFVEELAKKKFKRKQDIELREQQYLKDELELNNIAQDIQDILKQDSYKVNYKLQADLKQEKIKGGEDLDELDLYCKMDEEDILNDLSGQQNSKQFTTENTSKQNNFSTSEQQQCKQIDQEISAILQGNKLTERTTTSNEDISRSNSNQQQSMSQSVSHQPKESDYRLRWNGIMNNVNQVLKTGEAVTQQPTNPYSLKTNKLQQQTEAESIQFEEKKCADENDLKQTQITQESDFPDVYMLLDDIGDKVHFVPLSQQDNSTLNDSSINVKKNLLPEFEQEALRLEERKLEQQQQQLIQQQMKARNIVTAGSTTSTPTASNIVTSKTDRFNTESSITVSTKSKYQSNCEEQTFQSARANSQQPSFTQYQQQQQEQSKQTSNNNYFKESNTNANKFDDFLLKYEKQQKQQVNNTNTTSYKSDLLNTKANEGGLNNLKSDRLYTYQINSNRADGKDSLSFETQQYKYNFKKNDGEQDGISSKSELKGLNSGLTSSISVQNLQSSQNNGNNQQQTKNAKDDNHFLGAFTNPTLSKLVATHSHQKESIEDTNKIQSTQNKNSTTPIGSVLSQNTNFTTTSSNTTTAVVATKKSQSKPSAVNDDLDLDINEDLLEKENKDDSLLAMEKQIQKLEMMNKLEEEQQAPSVITQQRVLQQKDQSLLQQQSSNIPSQQSLAESRKQMISSISFPEDFLKKINKVKQYGTINQVGTSTKSTQQQSEQAHQQQTSSNSLIADPATTMQIDRSQSKNSLLKSSTSELRAQQKSDLPLPISVLQTQQEKSQKISVSPISQNIQQTMNTSPQISESSDIKKQEEEIQKLENLVIENNPEK